MKKTIVRIITTGILVAFFSTSAFFYTVIPQRVYAAMIVNDPVHIGVTIADFAKTVAQWIKDDMWKIVRDRVVRMLIQKVRDDIINSILNGGSPRFVTDWKGLLNDSVNLAFDSLNNELMTQGVNLCGPFAPQLQVHLGMLARSMDSRYHNDFPRCTVQGFAQNLQDTQHFMERGGWLAFDTLASPQGSLAWMTMKTGDAFLDKVANDRLAKTNEAMSSNGFLGKKVCTEYSDGESSADINQTCTENGKVDKGCVDQANKDFCTKWEIQTPGDVVGKALTSGINSDFPYLADVQSAISAIVNTVITATIDKGLTALTSSMSGGGSGGSGVSYIGETYTLPSSSGVSNQAYTNIINQVQSSYKDFVSYVGPGQSGGFQDAVAGLVAKLQSLGCSSTPITFVDVNGATTTETLAALTRDMTDLKTRVDGMYTTATQGLTAIAALNYSSPTIDSDVQKITDPYDLFTKEPLFGTVEAAVQLHISFAESDYGVFITRITNQLNTISCTP
jgi:hypothetical protein